MVDTSGIEELDKTKTKFSRTIVDWVLQQTMVAVLKSPELHYTSLVYQADGDDTLRFRFESMQETFVLRIETGWETENVD